MHVDEHGFPWPRMLAVAGLCGVLFFAQDRDVLAAVVAVVALSGVLLALRFRRPSASRRVLVSAAAAIMVGATLAAITLPTLRTRPQPLVLAASTAPTSVPPAGPVVSAPSAATSSAARPARSARSAGHLSRAQRQHADQLVAAGADLPTSPAGAPLVGASRQPVEIMGFAAADSEDTAAGVDRSAGGLSSLAVTGLTLAADAGALDMLPPTDGLSRAHLVGDEGLAVVSNYDGSDFSGERALSVLGPGPAAGAARARLAERIADVVNSGGWDGVVLDLENLSGPSRSGYPDLVRAVKSSIGNRRVVVALPAVDDPADPDIRPYDLAALGAAADQVVWMAYDYHDPHSDAGPIADLAWVRRSLSVATVAIPPSKVLLGVAAYGYAWPGSGGTADELTVAQARKATTQPGANATWDAQASEWHGYDASGRDIWYADGRAATDRAKLAVELHLGGVAIWRIGSDDPGFVDALSAGGIVAHKAAAAVQLGAVRPVEQTSARGVVALTFDDGPDPRWTPEILDILRREGVPGTFFVIGQNAEANQDLVRMETDAGVVGNHSYTHPNMSETSALRSRAEISGTEATIEGIIGRRPLLFRSPYGEGDKGRVGPGADALALSMGLHPISWNVDPEDWAEPGVDQLVQRVVDQSTERSIVLLHDGGGDRSQTLAALPSIIDELRARGFVFTTVDGLDASLPSPYSTRVSLASRARGISLIALFQLQHAVRDLFRWLLVAIAVLSLGKLLMTAPGALIHWRRARRRCRAPAEPVPDEVSVTILVPAYNEAPVIATTIETIARCHPRPTEVIVLDDGSTDGTAEVARAAGGQLGSRLRVLSYPNSGKAMALNRGMVEASNEIVMVIDADTAVDPGIAGAITRPFIDPEVGAVAGNVKVGNRRSFLSALQALEYVVAINWDRRSQDTMNTMAVVPGAAGAFRRSAVLAAGGYPADTLVEDADLTVTLLRQGWRIRFEESAVAWTEAPQRVSDVVRQRRRWSFGTIQVVAKHAHSLLEPRAGRIGLIGLPSMLVNQVILPTLGPLADIYLLVLLLAGSWNQVATVLALAVGLDLVVASLAVAAERERPSLLLTAPLLRLVWRPLQLWVIVRSARKFIRGDAESWRKIRRYGTVDARNLPNQMMPPPQDSIKNDLPATSYRLSPGPIGEVPRLSSNDDTTSTPHPHRGHLAVPARSGPDEPFPTTWSGRVS